MDIITLVIILIATIAIGFIAIDIVSAFTIGRGWRDSITLSFFVPKGN